MHHGLQGLLFVVTALLLSRLPSSQAARAFLALLLAYGVANIANDDWLEQVVERGWSSHAIPSVLGFAANWLWLAVSRRLRGVGALVPSVAERRRRRPVAQPLAVEATAAA